MAHAWIKETLIDSFMFHQLLLSNHHTMTCIYETLTQIEVWEKCEQAASVFQPFHGASSHDQHQNHDVHFSPSSSPCLYLYSDPYDGACASYALYPSPYLCPCAFYVSSPCPWIRSLISLQSLESPSLTNGGKRTH